MTTKNFSGFLNSPQFDEAEEFGFFTMSAMCLFSLIIFLTMEESEGLLILIGLVTLLANVKYFLFMMWDYYHSDDLVGINSIPTTLTSRYHAGAILLVEDKIKCNKETQCYEYDGAGFQDLKLALEAAMYEHIVFKDWKPEDINKMASEVVQRYFPTHY